MHQPFIHAGLVHMKLRSNSIITAHNLVSNGCDLMIDAVTTRPKQDNYWQGSEVVQS